MLFYYFKSIAGAGKKKKIFNQYIYQAELPNGKAMEIYEF